MTHMMDYATVDRAPRELMVLLPGALHGPQDFIQHGFVEAVRQRKLCIDVLLAELDFLDVIDPEALHRFNNETLQPVLGRGNYSQIRMAGISIGGYFAMAYAQHYPQVLTGMLLIAPYPGNRMTTNAISAAGGLAQWQPRELDKNDTELSNWNWLKHHAAQPTEVHLGYGQEDRFAPSHAMMASVLQDNCVHRVKGGHDWPAWRQIWQNYLDQHLGLSDEY